MFFSGRLLQKISTPVILLMGGPGCGKGCFAACLQQFNHFSLGESLRKLMEENPSVKAILSEKIARGALCSDDDILRVLAQAPAFSSQKPVLLDGFPRTISQCDLFHERFSAPLAVVDLMASEETLRQRLLGRGRFDDTEAVIERRMAGYFQQTRPMADLLAKKYADRYLAYVTDDCSPEALAEKFTEDLSLLQKNTAGFGVF